jgi:hypothetical protein
MMSNVGIYGGAMASLICAILAAGKPTTLMMWSAVSQNAPASARVRSQRRRRPLLAQPALRVGTELCMLREPPPSRLSLSADHRIGYGVCACVRVCVCRWLGFIRV